jgi:hypothetical protein
MFATGRCACWVGTVLGCLFVTGCGRETYPVAGQVVMKDGSSAKELEGYIVAFEGAESAVGTIRSDGSFELSAVRASDGAKPGTYKVIIYQPPSDIPEGPRGKPLPRTSILHDRYQSVATTDLVAEVKRASNKIELRVERARPKK